MILAFDTYYYENKAKTVCLAFENWTDTSPISIHSEILEGIAEYTPGEFYKRELPCILSLIQTLDYKDIETIIVDSFVYLDDEYKLGLGGHLYNALASKIPIIGVAKTNFATIENLKYPLLRGESVRPLYITAIGIDLNKASQCIRSMAGEFRIPTLLKYLDVLTKETI
jgi:deoxyribonuclease V